MLLSEDRIEKLKEFSISNGLEFKDLELLNRAFCHTSYAYENKLDRLESYEQLEFLGDAVLKLAVSDILLKAFPEKDEGALTERRAIMIADRVIAGFAEKLGFYDMILTGKCEGEWKNRSILACSFEAVLGAIYQENGYMAALNFLNSALREDILSVDYSNPKADLQNYVQKINHDLPEYVLLEESGPPHRRLFLVGVNYQNEIIGKGEGRSRKGAEFRAATEALKYLKERENNE